MEAILEKLPKGAPVLIFAAPGKQDFYRKFGFGNLKQAWDYFQIPKCPEQKVIWNNGASNHFLLVPNVPLPLDHHQVSYTSACQAQIMGILDMVPKKRKDYILF